MAVTKAELDEIKKLVATLSERVKASAISEDKVRELVQKALAKHRTGAAAGFEWPGGAGTPAGIDENAAVLNDYLYLAKSLLGARYDRRRIEKRLIQYGMVPAEAPEKLTKALAASAAGAGAEWVPTGFSTQLFDKLRLELKVAALHTRINMPTNPYKAPVVASDPVARLVPESATEVGSKAAESTPGTVNLEFIARKLASRVITSDELTEDSVVPILPWLRDGVARALAQAQENATINGDDSATHMDADVTAADDVRKAWKGYRKVAMAAAKVDFAGALDITKLRSLREKMGKYGINPAQLTWVVGIRGYNMFLGLKDGDTTLLLTLDKYGPNAPILTGELGKLDGIPVIVSEYVREDLNASGVFDGTTTTKTIVLLVSRAGFAYGDRRQVRVRVKEDEETEQQKVIASQRVAFQPIYDPATNPLVAVGYNI